MSKVQLGQCLWSWGQYLLLLIKNREMKRSLGHVLERVCRINALTKEYGASAYDLTSLSPQARSGRLIEVAVRAKLPVSLQSKTRNIMVGTLEGGAYAAAPFRPMATYVLGFGAILARRWSGGVPSGLARIPYIKGRVEMRRQGDS